MQRKSRWADSLRLLAPVLVATSACSQKLEGPKPSLSSVDPQVVCSAQLTTSVAVTGTNLNPLPRRTIDSKQSAALELPKFSLKQSAKLDGSAASGSAITIADDFNAPAASHVRWSSTSSMAVDVTPGLLADGVYELSVSNPDGQSSSLPNALAAVPPPVIISVEPSAICDAQSDQQITVNGTGFLRVGDALPTLTLSLESGTSKTYAPTSFAGCAEVATTVRSGLSICTSFTITVAKGDFTAGEVTLRVQNPAPASCSSSEAVKLKINPPPTLTSVSPITICQGGGMLTNIKGTNFQAGASVSLGTTSATQVSVANGENASAAFQGGGIAFDPGTKYDLRLQNPDSCEAILPQAVTAVVGPSILFADPPVAYNGITTQVTLYVTTFTAPLASVRIIPTGGTALPVDAVIDPNHSHRVLITVPAGTVAGQYDVELVDDTGCPATLTKGLTVSDQNTLVLSSVTPPFGWRDAPTAVTIKAAGGLLPTPRVYLTPHTPSQDTVATGFSSVAFVSATELTAIVPKNLDPAGSPYDLVVVNPDGTVGVLSEAYRSQIQPPPVIDTVSPGAVQNNAPPPITITGSNFRVPSVEFNCLTDVANNVSTTFGATVSASTATSITIGTPPVSTVPAPSLCRIRVTNGDDSSYVDFSAVAISNGSGNLSASKPGTALPAARRAPSLLAGNATRAARFLYVIGGDTGAAAGALSTVVTTTANDSGTGDEWFTQRYSLNMPRTQAGAAQLGRYLYVVGGNDGTGPSSSVERAMVLDPLQAPVISDVDVAPDVTGLEGGPYSYRVAAVMMPDDLDNPGGETLPSDAQPLLLPSLASGKKLQVSLTWTAVPNAVGYVIYRGPAYGLEEKIADVVGTSFIDTGLTPIPAAPPPLRVGSTGKWRPLPSLSVARESPGVAFGVDPTDATKQYLYATFGRGSSAVLNSYEYLPVTITAVDQTIGTWAAGAHTTSSARSQHSIYSATHENASFIPSGSNYIYLGGGTANGNSVIQILEVGKVQAGGDLGTFTATGTTIKSFGHGGVLAANYLYGFGDDQPSAGIRAGQISSSSPPSVDNYNNNGGGMLTARYLPGVTISGALIYVAGGSNSGRSGATNSVEWMIW
jgi:hypothetical protein